MSDRKINWDDLKGLTNNEIEEKAKEILSKMTIREKIGQMVGNMPGMPRYNFIPIPAGADPTLGIPGILFTDGPRGIVVGNSTCFPVSMARGATWDLVLEEKVGNAIGIEAKAQGANFFGGVCINLLRHPAWGRAQETYGEDPFHLGAFGTALIKGIQQHIMACAKHFACNSMENMRFKVNVKVDERSLREVYLWHFRKCVEKGVASIMSAYNKVNGKYCGHNSHLLRDILKKEWNFNGFVITDFVYGIYNGKDAVRAGVDIEMPIALHMRSNKLIRFLKKGEISEEQINEAVLRILRQKLKYVHKGDPSIYNKDKICCREHLELALEAAKKSIVLLKNHKNILPLNRNYIKKVAVIGRLADMPNIGDHGSSQVYPPYIITPLDGIKKAAGKEINVKYNEGINLDDAKELASQADVVIIIAGYTHEDEGEYLRSSTIGGDRNSLRLNENDEELILTIATINENCIVVLEGGSAIIIEEWKEKVQAILMAWYPGMEGGTAIGNIIFGDFNPCGKLPNVIPKSENQLPFFDKHAEIIEYGYYHGYKLMDKNGELPAFPFGFGLSYTTYSYKNLRLNKVYMTLDDVIEISVDITNSGNMPGEEIAQLYIGYINSSVDRPIKELKGFGKVALEPGETKTLSIELNANDLAFYDINSKSWIVEKIDYIAYIGPSSRKEDLLKANFKII